MKRYLLPCMGICLSLVVGLHIVRIWRAVILSQKGYTRESLLHAARLDPFNPDPLHKLGLFYQWNLLQLDLEESTRYFGRAIKRNPLEQEYWLNLARILHRMGRGHASERALENAILVFPTSYRGRWVAGNLLLQRGELERALPHFTYILSHYPNQSTLVYGVWEIAIHDPDFILGRLIPGDSSSLNHYLAYLYGVGDTESAKKAWAKLVALGYKPNRRETIRHIDFLISCGELAEADHLWRARLREEELPFPSGGNLVTNGEFEREKILGNGFDWRMETVAGAEISFDHTVAFEGRSSLRIRFNGEQNLDFHHVYQYVALKPNTDYLLTAWIKTEALTTKSGLKVEVVGVGPESGRFRITSESLTGDNAWRKITMPFRNPTHTQGAMIRLRRTKTEKFDRFISGTAWVDDVHIGKGNE